MHTKKRFVKKAKYFVLSLGLITLLLKTNHVASTPGVNTALKEKTKLQEEAIQ